MKLEGRIGSYMLSPAATMLRPLALPTASDQGTQGVTLSTSLLLALSERSNVGVGPSLPKQLLATANVKARMDRLS